MAERLKTIAVLIVFIALFGCGYRFVGQGGKPPEGINSLGVKVFSNQTSLPGIETLFTSALVKELTDRKATNVVSPEGADGVVEGTIKSISFEAAAHSGPRITSEERIIVILEVTLKRTSDGAILWQDKNLLSREVYSVSDDPQALEGSRQEAISKTADDLAETIFLRMFSGF